MLAVFWPLSMATPEGTTQAYPLAPGTAGMLNVSDKFRQMVESPMMFPGAGGVLLSTMTDTMAVSQHWVPPELRHTRRE